MSYILEVDGWVSGYNSKIELMKAVSLAIQNGFSNIKIYTQ